MLTPEQAEDLVATWSPFIDAATQRTLKMTLDDVVALVRQRQCQVWVVWDEDLGDTVAAVITELRVYPRRRVAVVLACGGRLVHRWAHLVTTLEAWAREEGCASIEVHGRKGWERILDGYLEIERVLSKELQS